MFRRSSVLRARANSVITELPEPEPVTSPLTSLDSISTPTSFVTSRSHQTRSPSDGDDAADTTTITCPDDPSGSDGDDLEKNGDKEDETTPSRPQYLDAAQPPYNYKSQIQFHLEEKLYPAAISMLNDMLAICPTTAPHKSQTTKKRAPVRIASPPQLAYLSTMAIHPTFTTRPPEKEKTTPPTRDGSGALSYLRGLLTIAGPVNANFRAAFAFKQNLGGRFDRTRGYGSDDMSGGSSGEESDAMHGAFAKTELLFKRAPNFWSVLGWAFRCAASYPERWKYWRVWLELMVEVLEADWDERLRLDTEALNNGGKGCSLLKESLLKAYLDDLSRERRNPLKEVIRALMAFTTDDAGDKAVYKEVFEKETAILSRNKNKRERDEKEDPSPRDAKISKLDLENDQWGDYLDQDDDVDMSDMDDEAEGDSQQSIATTSTTTRRTRRRQPPQKQAPIFRLTDGIAETVSFRLRIFRLLSAAAHYLPNDSFPMGDLYQSFSDRVRNLPLPIFPLFVEASNMDLPDIVKVSFYRNVVDDLLPAKHPDPEDVDPENNAINGFSLAIMEECFLPYPADRITAEDNAKLSIVLENMLSYLYMFTDLAGSKELGKAVKKGIAARQAKIQKSKGMSANDQLARAMLDRSATNLKVFAQVLGC
ncbi:hypothetical protein QBC35DRAFT_261313 [Podospora australis]|uniref:Uncharacterized protein n=1 Tax=Podospora australis TaxID=1536484 RepID=A0AAN7ALY8_9PEZI|nr:hypothetical protein QBC35DRAFT_261313 [Podospora australis]